MSNLIDEITDADEALRVAEAEATEASRRLRQCKRQLRDRRDELSRLIQELRTGESRHPLFERFAPNGDRLVPTADEHQRGPTVFPSSLEGEGGRRPDEGATAAKAERKATTRRTGGSGGKRIQSP
jgi:hypothetical protein